MRLQIFLVLLVIWILALVTDFSWSRFFYPLIAIMLFSILDGVFTYFKSHRLYIPLSSAVSGMLIGLILEPSNSIFVITATVLLAFLSKQFIKINNNHIFNPAAFGLIASSYIWGTSISWWAVSSVKISPLILLLAVYPLLKLRRIILPVIFLAAYFLGLIALKKSPVGSLLLTIDGTVLLFAMIMLPEPRTTEVRNYWKYLFPLTVILINFLIGAASITVPDPLLVSLLTTNIITKFLYKL